MKTNILTIVLLMVGFIVNAANSPIGITAKDQKITVQLQDLTKFGAEVKILNLNGNVIFTNYIKPNVTSKVFNLSELPADRYILSIENDTKIVDQELNLTNGSIEVSNEVVETYKPTLKFENNKIQVNSLLLGKGGAVKIMDGDNVDLYNENFDKENSIHKLYSIEGLNRGSYTVVINVNNKTFYHNLIK